jgi:hypothetical protein
MEKGRMLFLSYAGKISPLGFLLQRYNIYAYFIIPPE